MSRTSNRCARCRNCAALVFGSSTWYAEFARAAAAANPPRIPQVHRVAADIRPPVVPIHPTQRVLRPEQAELRVVDPVPRIVRVAQAQATHAPVPHDRAQPHAARRPAELATEFIQTSSLAGPRCSAGPVPNVRSLTYRDSSLANPERFRRKNNLFVGHATGGHNLAVLPHLPAAQRQPVRVHQGRSRTDQQAPCGPTRRTAAAALGCATVVNTSFPDRIRCSYRGMTVVTAQP